MYCTTTRLCSACGYNNICDSIKAGTKNDQEKIIYTYGPCNEGQRYCANCNDDWMPWRIPIDLNNPKMEIGLAVLDNRHVRGINNYEQIDDGEKKE